MTRLVDRVLGALGLARMSMVVSELRDRALDVQVLVGNVERHRLHARLAFMERDMVLAASSLRLHYVRPSVLNDVDRASVVLDDRSRVAGVIGSVLCVTCRGEISVGSVVDVVVADLQEVRREERPTFGGRGAPSLQHRGCPDHVAGELIEVRP